MVMGGGVILGGAIGGGVTRAAAVSLIIFKVIVAETIFTDVLSGRWTSHLEIITGSNRAKGIMSSDVSALGGGLVYDILLKPTSLLRKDRRLLCIISIITLLA